MTQFKEPACPAPCPSDNVFSDNTTAQITQQTPVLSGSVSAGYSGSILIGVPV